MAEKAKTIAERLDAELSAEKVKTREGAFSKKLSYLAGYQAELIMNDIFEHKFSRATVYMKKLFERQYIKEDKKKGTSKKMLEVAYEAKTRLTVWIDGVEIIKEGTGFGNGQMSADKVGDIHELALKEAETDSFKRAAKSLGSALGLKLYDADADMGEIYRVGAINDINYTTASRAIEAAKTRDEVSKINIEYEGNYKEEINALCLMRKKEIKAETATEITSYAAKPLDGVQPPLELNNGEQK